MAASSDPATRLPAWARAFAWGVVTVIVLLLLVRFVGSPIATSIVNKKLAALPGYPGKVQGIQLALWRGQLSATDLTLVQAGHEADGPVLKVGRGAFTLAPLALLHGKIAGRVSIHDVDILMIQEPAQPDDDSKADKKDKEQKHAQAGRAWQQLLQQNFPVEFTRLEVSKLKVKFVDKARALSPQMLVEDVHLLAHDFKTKPAQAGDLPAGVEVTGHFPGGGELSVRADADTGAADPTFKAIMEVKDLALVPLHDFLQSYALVDVSRGTFQLYVEVTAKGGSYQGYVKPFFQDLEFKAVSDPDKNLLQRAAVKVASAVQDALKSDEGKVATKAPFEGNFADNKVDLWQTIENLLRNAFVTGLREGFDGQRPNA